MEKIISTGELYRMISTNPENFEQKIVENDEIFIQTTVSGKLTELMNRHGKQPSDIISKSLLSKSYFYQVLQGERQPSREALIKMGIVCECNADEIQHLLLIAGEGVLYPKIRRDAAILFCIGKKMSLYETDEFLTEIGEKGLF